MNMASAMADQIMVNSRKVVADFRDTARAKLPAALSPTQFALPVSTIEPHKGISTAPSDMAAFGRTERAAGGRIQARIRGPAGVDGRRSPGG
jgi:hypothetical protein